MSGTRSQLDVGVSGNAMPPDWTLGIKNREALGGSFDVWNDE
ncbi:MULTISPECIES: hypothetical protein [Paenibacillus]|nr:hypothetical protein [Paenibacillus borealis]